MKKLLTILFLFCSVAYLSAEEDMSALLITEGERGIALEWYEDYKDDFVYIHDILEDEDGCIYVCGRGVTGVNSLRGHSLSISRCNARWYGFICKYSKEGQLLWDKEICSEYSTDIKNLYFQGDTLCFFAEAIVSLNCSDNTVYYDNEVISEHVEGLPKKNAAILGFCDKNSGSLFNGSWVNLISNPKLLKHKNDYIISGDIMDSLLTTEEFIFKGQTSNGYYDFTKINGLDDFYFVAFDENMNVKWDFVLGNENDDYYDGFQSSCINGDVLYVYYCFYGDSVNISPNKKEPTWVYGEKVYSNRDSMGAVLITYDISNEIVKLLNYRKMPYPNNKVLMNLIYSYDERGVQMKIYRPFYNYVGLPEGNRFFHSYVEEDLNVVLDTLKPYVRASFLGRGKTLDYDNEDAYYAITGEHLFSDTLLVIDYSEKLGRLEYSAEKMALSALNKFDRDNNYHYSLLVKDCYFDRVKTSKDLGVVYVSGKSLATRGFWINYKNKPEEYISGEFFAKFRETYKVSVDNDIKGGTLIVPDTLVWHGKDVEIGVNSDEGMCLKSLYANGLLLSVNEEGKYFLRNLSEPVVLSAEFVEASSIFEMESETFVLSSNSVSGYLELPDNLMFENYQIYTVEGKLIKGGRYSRLIDVNTLQPGVYQLRLSDKNNVCKITKFIKN